MERARDHAPDVPAATLYFFAFFSGAAALVYEVAWTKLLVFTFGRTTLAASAVVAGFMGGMGIGAWLYQWVRLASRRDGLRFYAALEIGIAVSAAALTLGFGRLPEFFAWTAAFVPAGMAADLLRVGLVLALLFVPSALMGATFPALCALAIRDRAGVGRHLGPIYGLNTVGAAAGALAAGLVLIEWLGLRGSVVAANAANAAIALAAWGLSSRRALGAIAIVPSSQDDVRLTARLPRWVTGVVIFGSGFATLAYEVVWFRALQYLFGNSTYALTLMLVVFLLGLGLGGLLFRRLARRPLPEWDLARCQLAIAVLALVAIACEAVVLGNSDFENRISMFSTTFFEVVWWKRLLIDSGLALAMMLPAALLMGVSFPLATRLFLGDVRRLGARVGASVLIANTGSILGSVLAALLILPQLGTVGGTRAIALINLGLGIWVLLWLRGAASARLAWGGAAAVAVAGIAMLLPERLSFQGDATVEQHRGELVFEEESDLATVQVWIDPTRPQLRSMTIDGAAIGVSLGWGPLYAKQVLLAHLPLAIDPNVRHTLNVGLGSASTLRALASYSSLETLDAVEISRAVVRASRFFREASVLEDPRVRLVVEDVSHFLLRTAPGSYDLVISDGKQSSLFSYNSMMLCRDFYENVLSRLSDRGLMVQWIPLLTPPDDFRTTLRTFMDVFPEVEVFVDAPQSAFLVGSKHPIRGASRWGARRELAFRAGRDLRRLGIPDADSLLSAWIAGGPELRRVVGPGPVSTWDRTLFEFSLYKTPLEVWVGSPAANLELLLAANDVARVGGELPFVAAESPHTRSAHLRRMAFVEMDRGDLLAARRLAREAVETNPADARAARLLQQLRAPGAAGRKR